MYGIFPENVKVLIKWLSQVEYVSKWRQGDHNMYVR